MNLKEQINKIKERYGILVVETEDGVFELKPTVEFYEKFLIKTSTGNATEFTEFLMQEFGKIVQKDLQLTQEEARYFVVEYLDDILISLESKLKKKEKRQMKN